MWGRVVIREGFLKEAALIELVCQEVFLSSSCESRPGFDTKVNFECVKKENSFVYSVNKYLLCSGTGNTIINIM